MKKTVLFFFVVAVLVIVFVTTVFARGGHGLNSHHVGRGNVGGAPITRYAICNVEDCDVYEPHEHNGVWYCSQSGVNWNNYGICAVGGCTIIGFHEHEGIWYNCANFSYPS